MTLAEESKVLRIQWRPLGLRSPYITPNTEYKLMDFALKLTGATMKNKKSESLLYMAVPKEKRILSAWAYIMDGNLLLPPNQDGTLLQ